MRFLNLFLLSIGLCDRLTAKPSAFQGLSNPAPATNADPYQTVGQLIGKSDRCTGTLIAPYVVLTAAHCVWGQPTDSFSFTLDKNPFWNGNTSLAKGREIHTLPLYRRGLVPELSVKSEMEINDLALVYLDSLNYGPLPSSFLQLATNSPLFAGKELMAPGYGINENKSHSQFRVLTLTIGRFFALADESGRMIPSALIGLAPLPGKSGTCYGDSGGPLLLTNDGRTEIVGVASTGLYRERVTTSDNCATSFGTVYTNVFHHRDWIESKRQWQPSLSKVAAPGLTSDKKNLWEGLPVIKGK